LQKEEKIPLFASWGGGARFLTVLGAPQIRTALPDIGFVVGSQAQMKRLRGKGRRGARRGEPIVVALSGKKKKKTKKKKKGGLFQESSFRQEKKDRLPVVEVG